MNLDGILHVRALRTASDSTLASVVAMVEYALSTRSPLERIVDRVSRIFVPCVVVVALVTFGALIRIIKQNLFWAFFYNTLGISLAITGILNPILAAAAMLLSSVSVIANSLRLANR